MRPTRSSLPEKIVVSVPSLPIAYINLIQQYFLINETDRVIDLGCGLGILTLELSKFSALVEGLDISREMIIQAQKRDLKKDVKWHCRSVEDFDFVADKYKLIISLESFHLFPSPESLIQRLASSLVRGGYLCVGWINYGWENVLKEEITVSFRKYGVSWDDWGYWACPNFAELTMKAGFSPVQHDAVEVKSKTTIEKIAEYLVSIDKASVLSIQQRQCLLVDLITVFKSLFPQGKVTGLEKYNIAFCVK